MPGGKPRLTRANDDFEGLHGKPAKQTHLYVAWRTEAAGGVAVF
jgi:hypothetical protein